MNSNLCSIKGGFLAAASFLLLLGTAAAHEGHSHGGAAPPRASTPPRVNTLPARPDIPVRNASPQPPQPIMPAPSGPPHRGEMKVGWQHALEVVYLSQQIRVYLYDSQGKPLSPEGVTADVALEVNGNPRQWWFRLEPASSGDHLVANVDLTRVRDRDMVAMFEFRNLPGREEPQLRFPQLFALTRSGPTIEVAMFTPADRAAVQQQGVCPVTGGGFDHGDPIKVLIDGSPVYLCCESCNEDLKKDPAKYLAALGARPPEKATSTRMTAADRPSLREPTGLVPLYEGRPQVSVAQATYAEDRLAVSQQRVCPVTGEPLGAHGAPFRMTIDGQSMYVCCKGCVEEVQKDPLFYVRPPAPTLSGSSCTNQGCSNCRPK